MSDAGERDGWNKAQKLVVGAAIAPAMRKASTRRVKVVDRETGEVKREAVLGEVLEGLVKAHGLEIEVVCAEEWCSGYKNGCRKRTPKAASKPSRVARRSGAPWTCIGCRSTRGTRCRECSVLISPRATHCRAHAKSGRKLKPALRCSVCKSSVARDEFRSWRKAHGLVGVKADVEVRCREHRSAPQQKPCRRCGRLFSGPAQRRYCTQRCKKMKAADAAILK